MQRQHPSSVASHLPYRTARCEQVPRFHLGVRVGTGGGADIACIAAAGWRPGQFNHNEKANLVATAEPAFGIVSWASSHSLKYR